MKRGVLLFVLLGFLSVPAGAQRLHVGLEWGATGSVYTHHDHQYTTLDGYHIDRHYYDTAFWTNGYVSLQAAWAFSRRFHLALCTGYQGIQTGIRSIPLSLRATVYPGPDLNHRGVLWYLEGGSGFSEDKLKHNADFVRLGGGYRIPLGTGVRLKLLASFQGSICQPMPYDDYDEVFVDESHLEYSYRTALAVSLGMALEW
ncbi:MAG: hypothetical protein J6P46_04480 [Bacteroidales bacterium]|nr:hypothetical protein [Bacteroidales bacterium]